MKIGVDARTLNVKGGSQTYAYNLLANIKERENFVLFGIDKFEDYKCIPTKLNQQNPIARLWYEYIVLPRLIKRMDIGLFHGLKGNGLKVRNVKTVITVHDIMIYLFPHYETFIKSFYWKYITPRNIKKADKIIAVSHVTKKDLVEKMLIDPGKIEVIHESFNSNLYKKKKTSLKELEVYFENNAIPAKGKDILLNVNTITLRKNIDGIIKSFNLIAEKYKNSLLMIVGRDGWKTQKVYEAYNKSPYKDRIYFLGFVSDSIIADLYNIAKVFIYPSFYEGFGLPILEAQACGCPVITSDVSSMPEIAGGSALIIDPENVQSIADAVDVVLEKIQINDELIEKGFDNIRRFSWKKCAEETLKVYQGE